MPIPPPAIAALADIDGEVVLPTLEPILSYVSLMEITQRAQDLIAQEVNQMIPGFRALQLNIVCRTLYPKCKNCLSKIRRRQTTRTPSN